MDKNCTVEITHYYGDWEKKIEAIKRLRNVLKTLPGANYGLRDTKNAVDILFDRGNPIVYKFTCADPGPLAYWLHNAFQAEGYLITVYYLEKVTL